MGTRRAALTLTVGYFYVIEVDLPHRPTKHGLCVCVTGIDLFFVNSEARSCREPVPIPNRDGWHYPWNDSFIDVSLIRQYQVGQIQRQLGRLHCEDCQGVIDGVNASVTLTPSQKATITQALTDYRALHCNDGSPTVT